MTEGLIERVRRRAFKAEHGYITITISDARALLAAYDTDDRIAKADLHRAVYARALTQMRDAITAVHDGMEDEGDRVYFGSSNQADDLKAAWHLADALHWDEILADTQPDTPLAETNLKLQAQLRDTDDRIKELTEALRPFAEHPDFHASDDWAVTIIDEDERTPGVTAGDFRRARTALKGDA
jgi:hypothetical protein